MYHVSFEAYLFMYMSAGAKADTYVLVGEKTHPDSQACLSMTFNLTISLNYV